MIEIKHRYSSLVLYSSEKETLREAVLEALAAKADLRSADLRYANLRSANLRSADLSYADLRSADLRSADLSYADLSSANLRSADLSYADLRSADLRSADLRSADLSSANLRSADLRYADLSSANLRSADLSSANLRSADLRYADLSSAKHLNIHYSQPLTLLQFQTSRVRALKMVNSTYHSIYAPSGRGITYKVGEHYEVDNLNTDPAEDCGEGLHVSAPAWIVTEFHNSCHRHDGHLLVVEFNIKDAVIPIGGGGKFRVRAFDVIEEIPLSTIFGEEKQ